MDYIADEILILNGGKLENRGASSELVNTINGYVWETVVEAGQLDEIVTKHMLAIKIMNTKVPY